ncbi:hypothetical protein [Ruminococcus sp.]|uniref:hypothetical protein n=1 Tax=Ruminococcus sp. TaxID=41978 RepID=UPI003864A99E
MMKRILLIAAAVLLMILTAACGKGNSSSAPATTAPQPATDAPYIDTQLSEPEWTYAEGTLQLLGGDSTALATGKDEILYFAIVTNKDGSQELRFKLSDTVVTKLKNQSADATYTMTLNDETIGTATLNSDGTEAIITKENTVGDITQVASKIRGLAQ